ncbi:MAG: hypothetical protein ACRDIX_00935 [Actinomycetota bacterium]
MQGHTDSRGIVEPVEASEGGGVMPSRLSDGLRWYVVEQGSVSVDAVSLSVESVDAQAFTVALVPQALALTTLSERRSGDP